MVPSDPNANPQDVIGPAVEGTLRILQDAAKVDTIKRIVVTSSVVALLEPKEVKYAYTEVDWFDTAPKIVQQQGKKAPGGLKYVASKVLAEHAAWDWVERTTPHSNLSQCFLPMCGVYKSILADPAHVRPEASNYRLLSAISRAKNDTLDLVETSEFTDVLDIAQGHVRALTTAGVAGQRFALIGSAATWQDALDYIAGNPVQGLDAPIGQPNSRKGYSIVAEKTIPGEKAVKALGMTYRSPTDTVHDTLAQALELGWKP
ncbi:hypothetical protein M408DRAFT_318080 [Serendipita vermifera MAFF 305830]|uniref:NAD-dependent epimerase/dehydratase domain-containing protein n=1 Tax=Serendipita vermifera MAFF 305830 TaxID=933852 RepID=A0A0C3BI44_SERVB|nr:hypothetical protein M408DRAFT_318080 [Serendipita vermifera MAFF 305830]